MRSASSSAIASVFYRTARAQWWIFARSARTHDEGGTGIPELPVPEALTK